MKFMTIPETAKHFKMDVQVIRRGVQSGKYPFIKVGNRVLLETETMQAIVEAEARKGLSIDEVHEMTGLSIGTIRRGIKEGWLPCWKRGAAFQFDADEVREALRTLMERVEQSTK